MYILYEEQMEAIGYSKHDIQTFITQIKKEGLEASTTISIQIIDHEKNTCYGLDLGDSGMKYFEGNKCVLFEHSRKSV